MGYKIVGDLSNMEKLMNFFNQTGKDFTNRKIKFLRWFGINNKIDKIRGVILLASIPVFIEVAVTFNYFGDKYIVLDYINYSALIITGVAITWAGYYYQITPIYVGLILNCLNFSVVMGLLFLAKLINVQGNYTMGTIGVGLTYGVGYIINLNQDKLVNIIEKLVDKLKELKRKYSRNQ